MTVEQVSNRQEQIATIIRRAAQNTDQDFNYLLTQARVESGLNPTAAAKTSSAMGLYQFTSGTWIDLVKRHGDKVGLDTAAQALRNGAATPDLKANVLAKRADPSLSAEMAARFAIENAQALSRSGHQKIGSTELYLAHFLGPKGADVFLSGLKTTPNAPAATALPQAAAANTPIFYSKGAPRSFSDIFTQFQRKFEGAGAPVAVAGAAAPGATISKPPAASPVIAAVAARPSAPVGEQGQQIAKIARSQQQPVVAPAPSPAPATKAAPGGIQLQAAPGNSGAPKASEPSLAPVIAEGALEDMQGVAAKALRQVAQDMGISPSDMPLDEAALGSFLRNFNLQQTDPALAPIINDTETRDASAGADVGWSETAEFGMGDKLQGHAIGGRLLMKATDPRDSNGRPDRPEDEPRAAPVVAAKASYADYASLWGGGSKAAPSR
jgi:hypothetical protein